jgi:hypothetical protein
VSDSDVQLQPDGTGKLVDTGQVTTGAGAVQRQRVSIADASTGAAIAGVVSGSPAATDYGVETRPLNYNWVKAVNLNPTSLTQSASATFNSSAIDLTDLSSGGASFSKWRVLIDTDQPGTINLQQSADTTAWYTTFPSAVIASTPLILESLIVLRYLRVQFVNGPNSNTILFLRGLLVGV